MRSNIITLGGTGGKMSSDLTELVLIIDDHPLFCEALQMTLLDIAAARVRTATTLGAALEALRAGLEPDTILLDLNLPDVAGLDGLARLRNAAPGVPVIVVSSMSDERIVQAVMQAGAAGFVPKHSARDDFVAALRAVGGGASWWPENCPPVPQPMGAQTAPSVMDRLSDLTPQQGRILALICEGYLNKQIAYELSISETTVKAHVTAILRKLGAQSRTQAVRIANTASFAAILERTREH
jgi:DNA-binding NarL/FixJ family response regulator